jgi:hypothetical protein
MKHETTPAVACPVDRRVSRLEQPWGDERLKLNDVYIGCVTKQNADILMAQAEIVECLYRFIDRMNDVCEEDPADRIVEQFTTAVMPLFDAHIDALFPKRAARKTANAELSGPPAPLDPRIGPAEGGSA